MIRSLSHGVVQSALTILSVIADVVEELLNFDIIEVLFLAELAFLEDASEGLNELMPYIDDSLAFNQLLSILLDDTKRAGDALVLLAALEEFLRQLGLLHVLVQTAPVANCSVKRWRLLHGFYLGRHLVHRLLHISLMHMLLEVVLKLLAFG